MFGLELVLSSRYLILSLVSVLKLCLILSVKLTLIIKISRTEYLYNYLNFCPQYNLVKLWMRELYTLMVNARTFVKVSLVMVIVKLVFYKDKA